MKNAELFITDGTDENTVNLFSRGTGFRVKSYVPNILQAKDGGVWSDSPFSEGRSVIYAIEDDVTDQIVLSVNAGTQDELIRVIRELRRVLRLAVDYWTTTTQPKPVYLKRRASCETEYTYTAVKMWSTPDDPDIFNDPFIRDLPSDPEFGLVVIHGSWLKLPPGTGECIPIDSRFPYAEIGTTNALLNPGFETAGGGGADVFGTWTESAGIGTIARDLALFLSGVASAKLTAGASGDTLIFQTVTTAKGDRWNLAVNYGTTATTARVVAYDATNLAIISTTILPAASAFTKINITILVPATCVSMRIYLYAPTVNGQFINYDDLLLSYSVSINAGIPPICPSNLILNPGFESQVAAGNLSSWSETAGAGAVIKDTAVFYSGLASAKLTGWVTGQARIVSTFYTAADRKYRFSFRHLNAAAAASFSIRDEDTATDLFLNTPIPIAASWTRKEFIVSVPAGTYTHETRVAITFYSPNAAQSINLDDVVFEPIENVSPYLSDYLQNPGFVFSGLAPNRITHIFRDETGTFSENLLYAVLPYNLVRAGLLSYVTYYGSASGFYSSVNRPIAVVMNLVGPSDVDMRGIWEYWNGAAWVAFADAVGTMGPYGNTQLTGGTIFERDGIVIAVLWPQANTVATTVNGVLGHWIRNVESTHVGTGYIQEVDFQPFFPNKPFVKIPAIASELPVLAEYHLDTIIDRTGVVGDEPVSYAIALRGTDRGADWSPIINFSNTSGGQSSYISLIGVAVPLAFVSSYFSASFQQLSWTPPGSSIEGTSFIVRVVSPLAGQYNGRFRVYLRAKQTAGVAGDVYYSIYVNGVAYRYDSTHHTALNVAELVDFGVVTIPGVDLGPNDSIYQLDLTIFVRRDAAGQAILYDLIFLPVDEWFAEIRVDALTFTFDYPNRNAMITSLEPKRITRGITNNEVSTPLRTAATALQVITPGAIVIPANREHFLTVFPLHGDFDTVTKITIYGNPRHYHARGDL